MCGWSFELSDIMTKFNNVPPKGIYILFMYVFETCQYVAHQNS